ncbi:alpha/beta hydrolase-fold protein [Solimonas terrae]|uniref:Alpha/beta hydrolase n=1 Tax=Solimonas terrae TaxID=1396819 RepID=A0A6M2BJP3_9GAMM|nr:alpha/beta hydrolase-fold protein [Solimonas terrae]NGY03182.1 alpha/beta hydrolase [Solimonas terrae]
MTSRTPLSGVLGLREVGSGRLDDIERFTLGPASGGLTREARIALPFSYKTRKAARTRYPLLLVLDAGDCFGSAVEMSRLMAETQEIRECIVAGIDGSPEDFAAPDGAAAKLMASLLAECTQRYRIDTTQTLLSGAGLAGAHALRSVLAGKDGWHHAIAANPAALEPIAQVGASSTPQRRRLVLVSGPGAAEAAPLQAIEAALQPLANDSLQILRRALDDEPHADIKVAALSHGLQTLLESGIAYGRKVESLRKPYMPPLLRLVSPVARRLLPRPGKSPANNRFLVHAAAVGRDYEVFTCLPASAGQDPARRYPTLLVLDANIEFATVAETAARMAKAGIIEELIVVGLGAPRAEGPVSFGYRRFEEFSPPADGYAFDDDLGRIFRSLFAMRGEDARRRLGQAPKLLDFIGNELLPQLADALPIDKSRLGLLGHSAGGTFVGYVLSQRPDLFHHYAGISPGVGICGNWLMRRSFADKAIVESGANVFLAVGEAEMRNLFNGIAGIPLTGAFAEQVRRQSGLAVRYRCFDGETHSSIFPRAVTQALSSFFVIHKPVS